MSSYDAPVVSPYDPSVPNYKPDTPPLEEVLRDAFDGYMLDVHKAMPAKIVALNTSGDNAGSQNVDVQPLPQVLYADATSPVDRPIIHQVPVMMLAGTNYFIKPPIAVGDVGLVLFMDRSIDVFTASDGTKTYDPGDIRRHDYNDAVFLPGLPTFTTQIEDSTTDMVLSCGNSQIRLEQSGAFKIQNQSQELFSLLDQVMSQLGSLSQALQSATVVDPISGPLPFSPTVIAALAQFQVQVQQIQTNLNTLKG